MSKKRSSKLAWALAFSFILAFCSAVIAAPTVSLKAVKKNNLAITPTNDIAATVGDIIEAEFYLSGWATELPYGVRGYDFVLAGRAGVTSGWLGQVLPVGWDAPPNNIYCGSSMDCPTEYPLCQFSEPCKCIGPSHSPELGAFITHWRADFIFCCYLTVFGGRNLRTLDYAYGFTMQEADGIGDFGLPYYAGTLKLKVQPDACGTFTFGIQEGINSYLTDPSPTAITAQLTSVPLTIHVLFDNPNACGCTSRGACRTSDQSCTDKVSPAICSAPLGAFQGAGSYCSDSRRFGDANGDGGINLMDFAYFQNCVGQCAFDMRNCPCGDMSATRCGAIGSDDSAIFFDGWSMP